MARVKAALLSAFELGFMVGFGKVMYNHFVGKTPVVDLKRTDSNMENKTAQEIGHDTAVDCLTEQQAEVAVQEQYSHEWDTEGDHCVKCGDLAWCQDKY
jgi:hypothetical protein